MNGQTGLWKQGNSVNGTRMIQDRLPQNGKDD